MISDPEADAVSAAVRLFPPAGSDDSTIVDLARGAVLLYVRGEREHDGTLTLQVSVDTAPLDETPQAQRPVNAVRVSLVGDGTSDGAPGRVTLWDSR